MTVTLRNRHRGRESETQKDKWEIGSLQKAEHNKGPARMNMEHVIECREEFAFGNQVCLILLTSVTVITQFKAAINTEPHDCVYVTGVTRSDGPT